MKHVTHRTSLACLCLAGLALACSNEAVDEADTFRAALPLTESVAVDGPETTNGEGAPAASANAPYATYYKFSRQLRDDVNAITAKVLGSVWFIAQTTPTKLSATEATWGPYTDSLEPATYRFRITKESDGSYTYVFEGRPKNSSSDDDYETVIQGIGYDQTDARHGDGQFDVDLDVAKKLDPVAHEDDSGHITLVHDLPTTITTELRALPRRIEVVAARSDSEVSYSITSNAREDNTGTLELEASADLDPSGTTLLETITMTSQWNADGEGRADVSFAGGDVPAAADPVTVLECWDSNFKRAYYHDSASIEVDSGALSSCPYDQSL